VQVLATGLTLTIHRGARQIGGSCVEVRSADTRVLLDLGEALPGKDGRPEGNELPDDLFQAPLDALILSHAHADHSGLLHRLPAGVPVWASAGTWALLEVSAAFKLCGPLPANRHVLVPDAWTSLGGLEVCAHPVDHSAPDAVALELRGGGARLLYSGDLRATGRKAALFDRLLRKVEPEPDALLLEGTLMGSSRPRACQSEADVEERLVELCRTHPGHVLVFASGQNLDRTVGAFRAAQRCGRELVLDLYTAWVQHKLRMLSNRLPQAGWDGVRVKFYPQHREVVKREDPDFYRTAVGAWLPMKEWQAGRGRFLALAKANRYVPRVLTDLDVQERHRDALVWSQWSGYLHDQHVLVTEATRRGLTIEHVHAGGHATPEDLRRLVEALRPKRLIPIHTGDVTAYQAVFPQALVLSDGQALDL
jgi:ribonuclease J